jgi:hypothetical protein
MKHSATTPSTAQTPIPHERIALRAYEKWVKRGRPAGTDVQDWIEAEAELRAEQATGAATTGSTTGTSAAAPTPTAAAAKPGAKPAAKPAGSGWTSPTGQRY